MSQVRSVTLSGEVLVQQLQELLPELGAKYHVLSLAVFGSRSRGDADVDSDLDLLVEFGDQASLFDLIELELDLEKSLGVKGDVLTPDSIKPRLRDRILESAVPV